MSQTSIIGIDIAKYVFQLHGADESGAIVFRKKLTRAKLLPFLAQQPPCVIALEACGGAHFWGREIARLGHQLRLIPPSYVKPFVKRQKNDAADAEAICEAAQRPTMRFVAVKSEAAQASALVFRARDLLVRQRTQIVNASRGHVTEFGWVIPKGIGHVTRLLELVEDEGSPLPDAGQATLRTLITCFKDLDQQIEHLDQGIARRAKEDPVSCRLISVPGVGPVTAAAVAALAPPAESFRKGRDFAAWVGLTPLQKSTGGKQKLGATSKMGERTLRRLLILGASAVIRQAVARGAPPGSWLAGMLARKPRMLVAVALANKTARIIWALLTKGGIYKAPVMSAA